jgi:hypothetical protein
MGVCDFEYVSVLFHVCRPKSGPDATLTVDITALADETGNVLQQLPSSIPASGNGGKIVA